MQRAEDEVTGFRGLDGDGHRLEVAHLADQHDVGVLAQRRAQRVAERRRVVVDLALVDDAALVFVNEFDRVLDGDDVIAALAVDVVDHRAERGRLAGTGRTGDEHEPLLQAAQLQNRGGEAELFGGEDLRRNHAEDGAAPLAVHEQVRAEARETGDLVGEVGVVPLLELLPVLVGDDRFEQRQHRLRRQRRRYRIERLDRSVLPDERRHAAGEVQIGSPDRAHGAEQRVDRVHEPISLRLTMWARLTTNVPAALSR